MPKKAIIVLTVSLFVVLAFTFYFDSGKTLADKVRLALSKDKTCAFCNPEIIKAQVFYEGNLVYALLNYKPILEGHSLILPKRHVVRFEDLTNEELAEMGSTIRKVNRAFQNVYGKQDYILILQNGIDAGQTEPHVHFHMIPRGNEWTSLVKAKLWLIYLTEVTGLRKPMDKDKMRQQAEELKESMKVEG